MWVYKRTVLDSSLLKCETLVQSNYSMYIQYVLYLLKVVIILYEQRKYVWI
jgi:hypothetical protein